MLLETFAFDGDVRALHVALGLLIGAVFGAAAQASRFCLRRALAGGGDGRRAGAVWLAALASAVSGFAVADALGLADLGGHRFLSPDLPVAAIAAGGLAFGAGMVLARGCVSRLTVLGATGNLRAVVAVLAFAVVAHATLKGVLAPLRTALGSVSVEAPLGTLLSLPGAGAAAGAAAIALAAVAARRARPGGANVALGVLIGLLPVLGWAGTSVLLADDFDPLPVQSVAFTLPWTDTLFWTVASTAVPATFGVGLVGGVLAGAFLAAAARGELALRGFGTGPDTLRYLCGAALMGAGGVLAGGCTVGAGLGGVAALSLSAILALAFIALGALGTRLLAERAPSGALA